MCILNPKPAPEGYRRESGIGYAVVVPYCDDRYKALYSTRGESYKRGREYAACWRPRFRADLPYKAGFHIFATKRGAQRFLHSSYQISRGRIVKVRYSGAQTIGDYEGFRVIVAARRTIIEEVS